MTNSSVKVAKQLVRIARLLVAYNRSELESRLKKRSDLNEASLKEHLDCLEGMDAKEQKAALYWISKKRLILPEDLSEFQEAMNLIDKQHLDFQKFEGPSLVIQWKQEKENSKVDTSYNPDHEPCFKDKKNLGDGVAVYTVDDTREGQLAVRKANDACWGMKFGSWCLSRRKNENGEGHELDEAWRYWNHYNAYPKRIAFKNGILLAFSAGDKKNHVEWWDKNDESHGTIPGSNAVDDIEFLKKHGKINLSESQNASPEILEELAEDEDKYVRRGVAEHPSTPAEILMKLAEDEDKWVRQNVVENPRTPVEVLVRLAEDKDEDVRRGVAENPNTPSEALRKLAEDKDEYMRYGVAMNSSTPVELLRKLAEDIHCDVRCGVAENPNTPSEILRKLAKNKEWEVRREVAENPSTPVEVLRKLTEDQDEWVREAARRRLKQ